MYKCTILLEITAYIIRIKIFCAYIGKIQVKVFNDLITNNKIAVMKTHDSIKRYGLKII